MPIFVVLTIMSVSSLYFTIFGNLHYPGHGVSLNDIGGTNPNTQGLCGYICGNIHISAGHTSSSDSNR